MHKTRPEGVTGSVAALWSWLENARGVEVLRTELASTPAGSNKEHVIVKGDREKKKEKADVKTQQYRREQPQRAAVLPAKSRRRPDSDLRPSW